MQGARRRGAPAAIGARALSGKAPPALPRHRRATRSRNANLQSRWIRPYSPRPSPSPNPNL
eukprot:scaffold94477_cov75-Phaeocystis_antarctica.AAC.3